MDESNYYFMNGRHIPAFGSWDCNDDDVPIPFTECFESARQTAGLFRYSYSEDRDLYVAGDLYQNDIVTAAMIVVPRRNKRKTGNEDVGKKEKWVMCNCDYEYDDVKEPPSPVPPSPVPVPRRASKAVDEDLYRISPELLYRSKRKGFKGFFSRCLQPPCAS